jgi:tetratricopeptide (TPR) repeat protein
MGLLYQGMSNHPEAIKAFRQAILINPNYDKAHNNLGIALMNAGDNAEAQREFNRALQINPKNTEAIINMALLSQKSGNVDQAKVQLLRVLQMNPRNAEAHYNLASVYEEELELAKAVEHYRKFLDEGSNSYPDLARDVEQKIQELSKRKDFD